MAKLYFKYGVMGSSKTAQVLITKFNYEENGKRVLLLKPAIDDRDGADTIRSRIGLEGIATVIRADDSIPISLIANYDVIICDESQFFSPKQIERLKDVAVFCDIPVLCYGLLTDFQTKLFPGSKRLIELADSLQEIKMVCRCGRKATVNARRIDGEITTDGEQILLGSNETYEAMCYECWRNGQVLQNQYTNQVADHLIVNGVTSQEWISVDDRLPIEEAKAHEQEWPGEYCEFLVMIEKGSLPTTLYYDLEENEWFRINTALERETYEVTHWMPMPLPPKGE